MALQQMLCANTMQKNFYGFPGNRLESLGFSTRPAFFAVYLSSAIEQPSPPSPMHFPSEQPCMQSSHVPGFPSGTMHFSAEAHCLTSIQSFQSEFPSHSALAPEQNFTFSLFCNCPPHGSPSQAYSVPSTWPHANDGGLKRQPSQHGPYLHSQHDPFTQPFAHFLHFPKSVPMSQTDPSPHISVSFHSAHSTAPLHSADSPEHLCTLLRFITTAEHSCPPHLYSTPKLSLQDAHLPLKWQPSQHGPSVQSHLPRAGRMFQIISW
jgi:hypothetical protein